MPDGELPIPAEYNRYLAFLPLTFTVVTIIYLFVWNFTTRRHVEQGNLDQPQRRQADGNENAGPNAEPAQGEPVVPRRMGKKKMLNKQYKEDRRRAREYMLAQQDDRQRRQELIDEDRTRRRRRRGKPTHSDTSDNIFSQLYTALFGGPPSTTGQRRRANATALNLPTTDRLLTDEELIDRLHGVHSAILLEELLVNSGIDVSRFTKKLEAWNKAGLVRGLVTSTGFYVNVTAELAEKLVDLVRQHGRVTKDDIARAINEHTEASQRMEAFQGGDGSDSDRFEDEDGDSEYENIAEAGPSSLPDDVFLIEKKNS
ncbi:hypothetical protein BJ742DRAFT_788958 [Cladochytrium replicatum]|nr:hypothetical protein BJ742DRAFT_788958 [Cladochytrium replicatum]